MSEDSQRPVIVWLLLSAAMVFAMAVIGAITRLTESGLSMVEWRPLVGALPPLTEADWQKLFDEYRATPEFQKLNSWMSLDDFKGIFWWEYIHRLWGRLIGLVFALPLAWFWWKGRLASWLRPWLVLALLLGALQGAVGWWMVASGLVDDPHVSHFRLAAHLGLAVLVYGLVLALAERLQPVPRLSTPRWLKRLSVAAMVQVGLGILTLILQVPIGLAAAHQAGALVLYGLAVWTAGRLRPTSPDPGSR
jgi:cytochrome c oxidase assembly protein subunit 15